MSEGLDAVERDKLEALRRIAKESFDAFDRGEYIECDLDSARAMIDKIYEKVRAKHARRSAQTDN